MYETKLKLVDLNFQDKIVFLLNESTGRRPTRFRTKNVLAKREKEVLQGRKESLGSLEKSFIFPCL